MNTEHHLAVFTGDTFLLIFPPQREPIYEDEMHDTRVDPEEGLTPKTRFDPEEVDGLSLERY
jgi:hypothetical protein